MRENLDQCTPFLDVKEVALEEDRAYATRSESEFASSKALHDIGERERHHRSQEDAASGLLSCLSRGLVGAKGGKERVG